MCGKDFDKKYLDPITGKGAQRIGEQQLADAAAARAQAQQQFEQELAYAKQRDADQLALAKQADTERQNQYNEMMKEATLTPEKIAEMTGSAAGAVTQSYDNAQAAQQRRQTAMGIDPGQAGGLSASRSLMLTKAGAVANAINTTTQQARDISQQRRDNARLVRIGLQPLALGLPSATLNTMGQGVNMYTNNANTLTNSGTDTYIAGGKQMSGLVGDILGGSSYGAGRMAGVPAAAGGG